ncbi:MAG: hypothetical protein HOK61_08080 [Alphaproteobacteria bacterium]|nr:hypothetical protein [Alphaproteobacteria bacterium]
MNQTVTDALDRWERLKSQRGAFENHWQDLARIMLPRRADFSGFGGGGPAGSGTGGERRTDQLYDGTPMLARRGLASAIDGLLKPKTGRWFSLRPRDPELAEDEAVARWLAVAEERLWRALYERDARFIQRSGEVDDDLVTFGTGVLFVGEGARGGSLSFRSVHLSDAWLAENADGVIDTIYVQRKLTAAQAAGVWGEEALGRETREAMRRAGADTDRVFEFVQAVTPRDVRDPGRLDNQHLP